MAQEKRVLQKLPGPGPYIGIVVNHLDGKFMGMLEVALIRGTVDDYEVDGQTVPVDYLSPFYGATWRTFEGNYPEKFDDVQKSYGMWMVPPDVGTKVMVIFVDSDPNQGYWIGCVQDQFQNHMVPGIAASNFVHTSEQQFQEYGTNYLPVAEFHKSSINKNYSPNSRLKPVHPFADRLKEQGLLKDKIRGVTSSSARREIPSQVFGISTPGPLDPNGPIKRISNGIDHKDVPVSRLGGTTFVMDDGDINGDNELVRIRTRTGHQILLHNTKDLIYIANSKGTAWIELTSNGKIDIYAADSVSIHSEQDFNFKADGDINLEAGKSINIKSGSDISVESGLNFNLIATESGKLEFKTSFNVTASDNINFTGNEFNSLASGMYKVTASKIHLNGPPASKADKPKQIDTFSVPATSVSVGWEFKKEYKTDSITSIMQRVPMHEPWEQHESIDPNKFSSTNLSRDNPLTTNPPDAIPADVPSDWTKDTEFINKVKELATKLKCNWIDLLICMSWETGKSFLPSQKSGNSNAVGLIQFIPSTAQELGTSTSALKGMTRVQQMFYVERYFYTTNITKVNNPTFEDLYMAILCPAAVGQSNDYKCYEYPSAGYNANAKALDPSGLGYITKGVAASQAKTHESYVLRQLKNAGLI